MIPELLDHGGKRRNGKRFAQHVVHTGFQILFFVFEHVGGQRHQRRQAGVWIALMDGARDVESGHIRQLDIQQSEIELQRIEHFQRGLAGHGDLDAAAKLLQHRARHDDVQLDIFHQQNVQRRQRHAAVSAVILHLFGHARRLDQHGKAGALAWRAAYGNIAAHRLRQTTRHRQPNAGAGRRLAAVLIFHLIIHGEDLVLLFLRNALAGVLYLEAQSLVRLIGDAHHDFALLGEFHRVADQVPQNLTQARAVGANLVWQR